MIYKGTESNIDHYSCFWDNKKQVINVLHNKHRKHKAMTHIEGCHLVLWSII